MARQVSKSIVYGWGFYTVILIAAFAPLFLGLEPFKTLNRVLLWQFSVIRVINGPHPILGYNESGEPIYEGTPIDGIVTLFGLALGFVVYPVLIFLGLTLLNRTR